MPTELLSIQPGELQFQFEIRKQVACSLQLSNTTDSPVAFKVKTTSPKKYCVRPNTGLVSPNGTCYITVTMQAQREAPPDMQCKDKFLVQSVVVPEGFKEQDITQELFNKESGKEVLETKLRVIYVAPPRPPSPVHEEPAEEAIQAGDMDSIDQAFYDSGKGLNELKLKLEEKKSQIAKLTEEKKAALQKTQQLQQEIASLRANSGGKMAFEQKTASGYSFLFILIVGLVGISLGYFLRS
ncbi:hypothetical protein KP509_39G059000 [Ceratopteris richardii]|uniref:MSP domain-containing protein n=2 Tax=Ceratopteris richardii TaxID=49495 RepID=A0A8T2Q1N7_CERRI|nr:hypothetical protein KP509_39G059000 [Ceratopteris richardii]KAH7277606.1 hypothetical protein KP509_39G059000 [Ceratopteris richardii]